MRPIRERPPDQAAAARAPAARPPSASPAHGVLALQRAAGNRAVTNVLARDGEGAEPTGGDAGAPKAAGFARATFTEIGDVALESVQFSGGGGGARETGRQMEITLTSQLGPHSARIMSLAASGNVITGSIVMGGMRVVITDATVSSYSTGGSRGEATLEQWSITALVKWEPLGDKK